MVFLFAKNADGHPGPPLYGGIQGCAGQRRITEKEEHMAENFVLKGNICYSQNSRALICVEQGYLVCTDGISAGVYKELPQMYAGFPLTDYGDRLCRV